PTDILDVTAATYTYLLNGHPPQANWTALVRPGERIRLRFINASAMTIFDVRIPGLPMTVVQADGNPVQPIVVDEFRMGVAETYDVIVSPTDSRAYTIFAQPESRGAYARGTLAPRLGMSGDIPPLDPLPLRTMADMGMDHGGMDHGAMQHESGSGTGVAVDNVAMMPSSRLADPGTGMGLNGRRALRYTDLKAIRPGTDPRPPTREIALRLTGNMHRYIWGMDGRTHAQAEPIQLRLNERVRFVITNDTMMEHPIHLHGLWSELDNGHGAFRPYKHTILVKPAERLSFLVTADLPGRWAFHCHLLYHMATGMFREVRVS
ncbi:MAG: multicopper oxidase domain-containing protein, partial [Acetobacteraceae bacterium]